MLERKPGNGQTIDKTHVEKPIPLIPDLGKAVRLELTTLGPLASPTEEIARKLNVSNELAFQCVLSIACLAVQGIGDVETLYGSAPLSLFLITIAESGARKSACAKIASREARELEAERVQAFNKQKKISRDEDKTRAGFDVFDDGEKQDQIQNSDSPLPAFQNLFFEDVTFEGLIDRMQINQPSVMLQSDEGGQFFNGHSMKNAAAGGAGFSKFWDGSTISMLRRSAEYVELRGKRLSMHLMVQPRIGHEMLTNEALIDQGFPSRCLIVEPESKIGERLILEDVESIDGRDIQPPKALETYDQRIRELLSITSKTQPFDDLQLQPRLLHLSKGARKVLLGFYNAVECHQANGGAFEAIKGFASKAPEIATRIAGVLTLYENETFEEVPVEAMERAVQIMEFYLEERLRLTGNPSISLALQNAEKLLKWLQTFWKEPHISIPVICRRGPKTARVTDNAVLYVQILEDHGWLIADQHPCVVDKTKSKKTWRIIR